MAKKPLFRHETFESSIYPYKKMSKKHLTEFGSHFDAGAVRVSINNLDFARESQPNRSMKYKCIFPVKETAAQPHLSPQHPIQRVKEQNLRAI